MFRSIAIILGLFLGTGVAQASNVVYTFTGTCTVRCVGTLNAELTLSDTYVPGNVLAANDAIDFAFTATSTPICAQLPCGIESTTTFRTPPLQTYTGVGWALPTSSGAAISSDPGCLHGCLLLTDALNDTVIISNATSPGNWQIYTASLDAYLPCYQGCEGTDGVWTLQPVPAPPAALLYPSALGLLGLRRRKPAAG